MKKIIALVILATFVLTGTYSCNKYEEGPAVTIYTKSFRLTRDWKLDKAQQAGVDITSQLPSLEQTFDDDGGYKIIIDGSEHLGTWEFDSDKENILIKLDGSSDQAKYKIIRLKSSELWLDEEVGTQTVRYFWLEK